MLHSTEARSAFSLLFASWSTPYLCASWWIHHAVHAVACSTLARTLLHERKILVFVTNHGYRPQRCCDQSSWLLPQEASVMIAERRKLFFFLFFCCDQRVSYIALETTSQDHGHLQLLWKQSAAALRLSSSCRLVPVCGQRCSSEASPRYWSAQQSVTPLHVSANPWCKQPMPFLSSFKHFGSVVDCVPQCLQKIH